MIDIGAVASDNTNLATGNAASAAKIDFSYSRDIKGVQPDNQDSVMSFDDFLDMINPLQHIPVVSSVYRAATGESINPISRIAGDTLYGAALGPVSAGLAALGAIGDEIMTAATGKSASGTVMAALFGDDSGDKTAPVQVADAGTTTATPAAAPAPVAQSAPQTITDSNIVISGLAGPSQGAIQFAMQTPARQSPILQDMTSATTPPATTAPVALTAQAAPANLAALPTQAAPASTVAAASAPVSSSNYVGTATDAAKAIPLDRSKLAYGGVMDGAMVASAQQNQAIAMAMTGQSQVMQAQRALRGNRFATSLPGADMSNSDLSAAIAGKNDPQTQQGIQSLMQQLQATKNINQYKSTSQVTPLPGGQLDIAN